MADRRSWTWGWRRDPASPGRGGLPRAEGRRRQARRDVSVLVVVVAVAGMPVLAVLVVGVPRVLHQGVAAAVAVHVHMSRVGDMEGGHRGRDIVHVIHV